MLADVFVGRLGHERRLFVVNKVQGEGSVRDYYRTTVHNNGGNNSYHKRKILRRTHYVKGYIFY